MTQETYANAHVFSLHLTGTFLPVHPSLPWAESAVQSLEALPAAPARQAGAPAALCECTRLLSTCAQEAPSSQPATA